MGFIDQIEGLAWNRKWRNSWTMTREDRKNGLQMWVSLWLWWQDADVSWCCHIVQGEKWTLKEFNGKRKYRDRNQEFPKYLRTRELEKTEKDVKKEAIVTVEQINYFGVRLCKWWQGVKSSYVSGFMKLHGSADQWG